MTSWESTAGVKVYKNPNQWALKFKKKTKKSVASSKVKPFITVYGLLVCMFGETNYLSNFKAFLLINLA